MKSAYPSSQSFFDASSDSIRATDVEKCRTSASFSSLADLFARNPNCQQSDLFSKVRTPVFVPTDVTFPSRKDRECEDRAPAEKVSIWHEWGSGECPGEESSGLLMADVLKPSGGSELYRVPSSNLFPNLGSANATVVSEEFTFPERRNREDESWRERRGFRQDWIPTVTTVESSVRESTAKINRVRDFFGNSSNLLSTPTNKPSLFSNLGAAPMGSQSEFPARRKRDENTFWKDYANGVDATPSECTTSGSSTSGVNSLSGLYSKSPADCKCSSLFSSIGNPIVNSEEVVFPSRRKNPDRNAWRDWSNTGYSDWAQDDDEEEKVKEVPVEKVRSRRYNSGNEVGIASKNSGRSGLDTLQSIGAEALRNPTRFSQVDSRLSVKVDSECETLDSAALIGLSDACNAERANQSSEKESEQKFVVVELDDDDDDVHMEKRYKNCRRDLHERNSRQKVHSFPPPLGFLGRQGSLRVPHHLPWVQLQPVRSEGRFMLQEVKVTQPVVFEPIREQGRLVLQLIRQDDLCDSIDRDSQGCEITRDDSNSLVKEQTAEPSADKGLEVEEKREKHASSRATDEPQAVDRESLVKEKVRRANKCPKIHPEGCLPTQLEVDDGTPKLEMEKGGMEPISLELKAVESQELMNAWTTKAALDDPEDGRLENRTASLMDPGQESFLPDSLSQAAFFYDKVVDVGLKEEKPSLFRKEIEAPSQKSAFRLRNNENYKSAFRSCSRRNAGLVESGAGFPPPLHRTRSIRNTNLSDYGRLEGEIDELASKDPRCWRGRDDEGCDPRPPVGSPGQGHDSGALGLRSTSHFLQWSLKKRHEAPGHPDARLTNYGPVAASFSCAEGVGKRHHEKSFWEQPCVS